MDTSDDGLVRGFLEPALSKATRYGRTVGYFSSGWLKTNAKGMLQFATNGGRGRWVNEPDTGGGGLGRSAVSRSWPHYRALLLDWLSLRVWSRRLAARPDDSHFAPPAYDGSTVGAPGGREATCGTT